MKKVWGVLYTSTLPPHGKTLFEKCPYMYFLAKRSKRRHFGGFRRQGRRRIWVLIFQHLKLGPICAHLQKDSWRLGKNQQNESPKAMAHSKTVAPFDSFWKIINISYFPLLFHLTFSLNLERWQHHVKGNDSLYFNGIFCSDHFM